MVKLPPDFKEFLTLLNFHKVDYLLVGGYAVCLHGYPRYTSDMDIWVAVEEANASKIVNALKDFGFAGPHLSTELFLQATRMTQLGREPVKIEILNRISGVQFSDAQPRACLLQVDGVCIPVISLADLRLNKAASGRSKDLADLDNLPLADNL